MAITTIIEGDETLMQRDRRFYCPFCNAVFSADYANYTLATLGEEGGTATVVAMGLAEDPGIVAFATCPTCGNQAVSPVGSKGLVPTEEALVILSLPTKQIYKPGDNFSTTGLKLGAELSDGSIADVALADCTLDPATTDALTADDEAITVTYGELEISVPIAVRNQVIPEVQLVSDDLVYNEFAQTVVVRYYSSDTSTAANNSKTNAGSYTATFTPKTGYCWPDGSTDAISIAWHIAKAAAGFSPPEAKTDLVYTGEAQRLTEADPVGGGTMMYAFPEGEPSSGTLTATDAGTYTVNWEVVPDDNHEIAEGDVASGSLTVVIDKATPTITLTPSSLAISSASEATVAVDCGFYDALGIGVVSTDSAVCTAAATGKTLITVTPVASGEAAIRVATMATTNCLANEVQLPVTVTLG